MKKLFLLALLAFFMQTQAKPPTKQSKLVKSLKNNKNYVILKKDITNIAEEEWLKIKKRFIKT